MATGRRAETGCRRGAGWQGVVALSYCCIRTPDTRLRRLAPPLVDALALVVLVQLHLVTLVQAHDLRASRQAAA